MANPTLASLDAKLDAALAKLDALTAKVDALTTGQASHGEAQVQLLRDVGDLQAAVIVAQE